jgi:hypothetical protein
MIPGTGERLQVRFKVPTVGATGADSQFSIISVLYNYTFLLLAR